MYFYSKELSNKHILRKNFRFYFLLIVLFLLSYLFYQSFGKSFFMGEDIISKRFSSSNMDAGVDARFGFWRKVFSNLTFNRVIFGNGVQSFSEIGKTYGVNTYAHSVFIDMLICGGLISFTAFISLIYSILRKAVKLKLHYIIPIVVYAILSYLSDGTINETLFWVPIGISIGLLHRASK